MAIAGEVERGLLHPSDGKKRYTDDRGKVVKVVEWFGDNWHLLVDPRHEVPLACQVSGSKASDNEMLLTMITSSPSSVASLFLYKNFSRCIATQGRLG